MHRDSNAWRYTTNLQALHAHAWALRAYDASPTCVRHKHAAYVLWRYAHTVRSQQYSYKQRVRTHMRAPSHTIDSSWACPAYTHTQDSEVYKRFSDIYSVFCACAHAAAVYTLFGCQAADQHALRCRIASLCFPLAAPQRVVGIHVCIQYIHRVTYIQPPCDTVPFSVAATYVSITLCHVAGLPAVCSRTAATT